MSNLVIISGSSNPGLAKKIARHLKVKLGKIEISKFPMGEKRIRVKANCEGKTVVIIQTLADPADEHILELLLIADAVSRLKSRKIMAVCPWLAYSPQDKVFRTGEPLSAKVIADCLNISPIDKLVTLDLHNEKLIRFYKIPVVHLDPINLFGQIFSNRNLKNYAVLIPDKGARKRSRQLARLLKLPLVEIIKSRSRARGKVTVHRLVGDVKNKNLILIDDFISTGQTLAKDTAYIKSLGARKVFACVTHAHLPEIAYKNLKNSELDKIYVTDSVPLPQEKRLKVFKVVSLAPLISQTIKNL